MGDACWPPHEPTYVHKKHISRAAENWSAKRTKCRIFPVVLYLPTDRNRDKFSTLGEQGPKVSGELAFRQPTTQPPKSPFSVLASTRAGIRSERRRRRQQDRRRRRNGGRPVNERGGYLEE